MNKLPELKSGVNEKLKEVCPNVDISQAQPINQKRLVTFINHFLLNTVDFLNQFSKHCTYKLLTFDKKINRIEAELCLLESKLNSIPEVADNKDVNVELPKPDEPEEAKPVEKEIGNKEQTTEVKETEEVPAPEEAESPSEPENPELLKYRKMVQVGVPKEAVKLKMRSEGLDPNLLDS